MQSHPSSSASPPRSGVDLVPAASSPSAMTIQDSTVVPAPKLATESEDGGPPDGPSSPSPRSNSGPRHPPTDGVAESYDEVDDDWDTLMPHPPPPNFFGSSTSFDVAPGTFNVIRPRGRIDKPISGKPKPKPKARPASTPIPEHLEEHSFPPLEGPTMHPDPTQRRGSISDPDISRSYLRKYIRGAYISLIAPSFVHDKSAFWDLQRLENRLNVLQTWVWAANAALFAASAALLALSDVSRSVIAQSFIVLSGIFGLYGFVYSVFLAFHIGDSRAQFSTWFLDHANSMHASPSESFWDVSNMLSLPLTWMAWAVLSLVCFLISFGIQIAISDLQILLTSGQTETDVPVVPAPNSTLNIFQLAIFIPAIVWSSCYVVMIHLQIRRCKSSTAGSA
ncbi:hypothetical protein DFH09DRAFT_1164448 [Mycena vulgaris]|nr:hypothetical protein DFH09DRAFT_1164448 [Mycena vulgaris]